MHSTHNLIRILTFDDHPLLRKGIAALVNAEPDLKLVAEASNGKEAIEAFRTHAPDVSLMDLQMPGMGGEELAEIALRLRPAIRVVFTSGFRTPPRDAAFVPKPYKALDLIRVLPPLPLPS